MTVFDRVKSSSAFRLLLVVSLLFGTTSIVPLVGQTVTVDSSSPPVVVNSVSDLDVVTPQNGRIVIIRTGDAAGVFYYDKTSSTTVDDIDVIAGPGGVGRFLRLAGGSGGAVAEGARVNKVANVEALFDIVSVSDNDLYQTLGYSTEGVGANLYRYDASSTATIDGGFVQPGIGGTLAFTGTTFSGIAGTGRFIAVDQTIAVATTFGAVGDDSTDDTAALKRWVLKASTHSLRLPNGQYRIASTLTLPVSAPYFTLSGDGNTSVLKSTITDGSACLDLNSGREFRLENFRIAGLVANQNFIGIDASSCNRWSIVNVEIAYAELGIDLTNAWIGSVSNLFVAYSSKGFTANQTHDIEGSIRLEQLGMYFSILDSFSFRVDVLAEGDPATTQSTIDGSQNVSLDVYYEDTTTSIRQTPFVAIGTVERCTNIFLNITTGNTPSLPVTFTAVVDDTITSSNHGLQNGTVVVLSSSGALPSGLSTGRSYYVRDSSTNTFKLAVGPQAAAVDISSTGSGIHSAEPYTNSELVLLDNVDGCFIKSAGPSSGRYKQFTTTTSTKNLRLDSYDLINDPTKPGVVPASLGLTSPLNYWPDPFMGVSIPVTLSEFNATAVEELIIKPTFASRSLKVSSTGSATTNIAYREFLFSEFPQLLELRGKKVGIGWWQYYDGTANYSSLGVNANGPQVRIFTDGAVPVASSETYHIHYPESWQFITGELDVPSDATKFTLYYYSNSSASVNSDASMIAYFVGPLVWVGGRDNAQRVLHGDYSHHPLAMIKKHTTTGEATGFTAGAGTAVNDASTFTGGVGSTAYRLNDVVKALKNAGFLAP